MKMFTLKRNPDEPSELEFHLEVVAPLRAGAWLVWKVVATLIMGALMYRAYLSWLYL